MIACARAAFPAALVIIIAGCISPAELNDPRHEGRSATAWIKQLGKSHIPNEIFGQSSAKEPTEALLKIGPAAVPACLRALTHKDWHVRAGAAHALALYGPDAKPAVPALVEAVTDPYATVRSLAAGALAKTGEGRAAIPLLTERLSYQDPTIRISVAYALARIDPVNDAALRVLIDGLQYFDAPFRDAVGGWGPNQQKYDSVIHVETRNGQRLLNREDGVRTAAAMALGGLGGASNRAFPKLVAVLRNRRYFDAPRAAAFALGEMGADARPAVPALIETLASVEAPVENHPANEYLVRFASVALGKIGVSPADLPELYRMIKTPRDRYNEIVVAFAGAPAEALPELIALVPSADPVVARRAATALGKMGPKAKAAGPALVEALRQENPSVRSAAAYALGEIGVNAPDAVSILRERLEDADQAVRSAAETALRKLDPTSRPAAPVR